MPRHLYDDDREKFKLGTSHAECHSICTLFFFLSLFILRFDFVCVVCRLQSIWISIGLQKVLHATYRNVLCWQEYDGRDGLSNFCIPLLLAFDWLWCNAAIEIVYVRSHVQILSSSIYSYATIYDLLVQEEHNDSAHVQPIYYILFNSSELH